MNQAHQSENQVNEKYNVLKHPLNSTKFFEIDKSQNWATALLKELNEKAEEKTAEEYLKETTINVQLEITKSFKQQFGEYLLVSGSLKADYYTTCIRNLEEMQDSVEVEFKACFLHSKNSDDEELKDQTEIFISDNMHELYFFEKGFANLYEMIHEQTYLNVNQYPVKDKNQPLNWGKETPDTKQ